MTIFYKGRKDSYSADGPSFHQSQEEEKKGYFPGIQRKNMRAMLHGKYLRLMIRKTELHIQV